MSLLPRLTMDHQCRLRRHRTSSSEPQSVLFYVICTLTCWCQLLRPPAERWHFSRAVPQKRVWGRETALKVRAKETKQDTGVIFCATLYWTSCIRSKEKGDRQRDGEDIGWILHLYVEFPPCDSSNSCRSAERWALLGSSLFGSLLAPTCHILSATLSSAAAPLWHPGSLQTIQLKMVVTNVFFSFLSTWMMCFLQM